MTRARRAAILVRCLVCDEEWGPNDLNRAGICPGCACYWAPAKLRARHLAQPLLRLAEAMEKEQARAHAGRGLIRDQK